MSVSIQPASRRWGLAMQKLVQLDFATESQPLYNIDWQSSLCAVEDDAHLVGVAIVERSKPRFLAYLVVRDTHRHRGIARQMLNTLLARQEPLLLTCMKDMAHLYAKFAFSESRACTRVAPEMICMEYNKSDG